VVLKRFTGERFNATEVAGGLADPPPGRPPTPVSPASRSRAADPLLAIEPAVYIEALTGRRIGRDGKVACPFHEDQKPSLHAYPEPARGWACYSAKCWRGDRPNGGDIYDLADQLWGLPPQTDYLRLRRRLYAIFLPGLEPSPRRRAAGASA
jgi:hypothetical protein